VGMPSGGVFRRSSTGARAYVTYDRRFSLADTIKFIDNALSAVKKLVNTEDERKASSAKGDRRIRQL
jgi:hypothetical protein